MPFDLESRVFSSETLLQGLDLLERSVGMDALNASDAELQKQLEELEERESLGCIYTFMTPLILLLDEVCLQYFGIN